MSAPAPNASLMQALGRLVRGLSALFWGLPFTLLVCAHNLIADWFRVLGVLGPLAGTAILFYGVRQLGHFQQQERIWIAALERAQIFALINVGLAPFIYWWNRVPDQPLFIAMVHLFFVTALLFLHRLNLSLERLVAMLPDETLREDTRFFTRINRNLLVGVLAFAAVLFVLQALPTLPDAMVATVQDLGRLRQWLITAAILPPVAMTMTLLWKIKETIFTSVFDKPA